MKLKGRSALVTGGNRGIGFEVCRLLAEEGMNVFLGSRDKQKGIQAAEQMHARGLEVDVLPIDMASTSSILGAIKEVEDSIDVLVNNAAVLDHGSLFSFSDSQLQEAIQTNLVGPVILAKHLAEGMRKKNWGRIVNVSSGMGAISRGLGADSVAYRLTKLALNGFTVCLAQALHGTGVLVNSVDPGWVRTEMGGPLAHKTPEQGAREIVAAVFLPDDGPSGAFFRAGKKVDW